jgi:hypothetical protein
MKRNSLFAGLSLFSAAAVFGADHFTIVASNPSGLARSGEVVAVPYNDVLKLMPGVMIDHLIVKDAKGATVTTQVLNFEPEEHKDNYLDLIFQHDFAAGEKTAKFTVERVEAPVPPVMTKVFARYIPERFDDFAWENDRVAHRIYGPGLDTPVAGSTRMISSGIDIWSKRVAWPIVDRWYLKGHYHEDSGEGQDFYDVGTSRGCGGTGIWDGQKLHVSHNWASWKVLANGPMRAVFDISYAPWDAAGVQVSETKRFTVDAGRNLDLIESTFTFKNEKDELTVAIGIAKHKNATGELTKDDANHSLSFWENYPKFGLLGTGIVLAPDSAVAGYAEDAQNHLVLVKVKSGQPLRYLVGAGWDRAGQFKDQASWNAYLEAFAKRLAAPVTAVAQP